MVPVTETLPEGEDYMQWMTANVAAVRAAVGLLTRRAHRRRSGRARALA